MITPRGVVLGLVGVAALFGGRLLADGAAAAGHESGAEWDAEPDADSGRRLVLVGADVAEIVFALGAGADVVALDDGAALPVGVAELPRLGYLRALSTEGILALTPDRVLVNADAGPPHVLTQLRAAGVPVDVVPAGRDVAAACDKLRFVAARLGSDGLGARLADELQQRAAAVLARRPPAEHRPRVLFLYARGPHSLHVSGRDTPADALLSLAGARNAIDAFEGYSQLTGEAVVLADPDVLLVPAGTLNTLGGVDALLDHPALALTRAARERRVIAVDDAALGFGPSLAESLEQLAAELASPAPVATVGGHAGTQP